MADILFCAAFLASTGIFAISAQMAPLLRLSEWLLAFGEQCKDPNIEKWRWPRTWLLGLELEPDLVPDRHDELEQTLLISIG